jgi:hypothetical protein
MALDPRFQYDLKVNFKETESSGFAPKATLSLSATGDLQFVSGKDKLVMQLIRALVNQRVGLPFNIPADTSGRQLQTLVSLVLRNFKRIQVEETDLINPNFIGFTIYRRGGPMGFSGDTSDTFVKISKDEVTHKFLDLNLSNGSVYEYGISKTFRNGAVSPQLEQINVTPSQFLSNQKLVIGTNIIGIPGNETVTLYVNTNRLYKKSELLESIEEIRTYVDATEPRRMVVDIEIRNLLDSLISLAIGRQNKIT